MTAKKLTISATKFKAHCFELIDLVHRNEVQITITKHGKPVARLVCCDGEPRPFFGSLPVVIVGNIVASEEE